MNRFALFTMSLLLVVSSVWSSTYGQTESSAADTVELTAEMMFAPDRITNVEIRLAEADWDTIRTQSRTMSEALTKELAEKIFTYVKGDVSIDGVVIKNVGIRKKGFIGSLNDERPSLKIKFAEYEKQSPVKGLDRLTLNNNNQDAGRICQYLAYKLFRDSGTHAPRCGFAKVTVNGKYLGIYSNVEAIKSDFLKHSFGDSKGAVYEGTITDFYRDYVDKFERKNKAAKAKYILKVAELLDATELDLDELDQVVDVDSFLKFWAMESLIGFWDGYCSNQNNYYLHRSAKTKKFDFIPWGTDSAFTDSSPIPPFYIRPISVHGKALLPNKLYQNEEVKAKYKSTMMSLLEEHWNEEKLLAEVDRVQALLEPEVLPENKEFKRTIKGFRSFIKGRRKDIVADFEAGHPKLASKVNRPMYFNVVGEVEATFKSTYLEKEPAKPTKFGEVSVQMKINGKEVVLKDVGVYSKEDDRNPKNASIIITGTSVKTGKIIVIGAGVPKTSFHASDSPTMTGGVLIQPGTFGVIGMKMKMMFGTVRLDKASLEPGDKVEGTLKMSIGDFKMD